MSSPSLDPLHLLRQYTVESKKVELLDKNDNPTTDLQSATTIRFGDEASFPRDTATSLLRSNSDSDPYTLSALLHFLDHRDQSFYEYMKMTNTLGLQTISFGDRAQVLGYLTGKTPEAAASGPVAEKQPTGGDAKRAKTRASGDGVASASTANDIARDIIRRERALVTPSTVLSSNKSFARVPDLAKALLPAKPGAAAKGAVPGKPATADTTSGQASAARRSAHHRKRRNPIIVVPAATTSMLTMYNIKSLLQDHQFVDGRAEMEKAGPKPHEVFVEHTMSYSGQAVKFRIVDSVQDFTEADWEALVCVFTQGAAWQFRNWMWKTPEEVFHNCLGFYPKYQDERPKDAVNSWAVSLLNIERSKRHMDRATVVGLWNSLEQYMARNKPDLLS
ncbi:accessory factor associated with RNA polymerase II [Coemansia spiralis]|uniref:Accessory factor associated with RNA polymerase II n=1 Tax=Coemansia spiralis TaxID=417178 RepID=A0A9W8GMV3_9FUNG|nr:accessory factor associated with RNA polymerase II [Coemansia spiralis]